MYYTRKDDPNFIIPGSALSLYDEERLREEFHALSVEEMIAITEAAPSYHFHPDWYEDLADLAKVDFTTAEEVLAAAKRKSGQV